MPNRKIDQLGIKFTTTAAFDAVAVLSASVVVENGLARLPLAAGGGAPTPLATLDEPFSFRNGGAAVAWVRFDQVAAPNNNDTAPVTVVALRDASGKGLASRFRGGFSHHRFGPLANPADPVPFALASEHQSGVLPDGPMWIGIGFFEPNGNWFVLSSNSPDAENVPQGGDNVGEFSPAQSNNVLAGLDLDALYLTVGTLGPEPGGAALSAGESRIYALGNPQLADTTPPPPLVTLLRFVEDSVPDPIPFNEPVAGIQVEAYDPDTGLRDTSFTGPVTVGVDISMPQGARIVGGQTTVNAVAGVATFTLIFGPVGIAGLARLRIPDEERRPDDAGRVALAPEPARPSAQIAEVPLGNGDYARITRGGFGTRGHGAGGRGRR